MYQNVECPALHLSGKKNSAPEKTAKFSGGPTSTTPTRRGGRLGDGLCEEPDTRHHGTHASLTAPPWSHGSMGHPGRAPQPFKKKKTRGCRVYLASRTETAAETAGAVRGGGFGTCAGIRIRTVRDR